MSKASTLVLTSLIVLCSLILVEATDEGTLCGLPRCTNLLDPFDGCGDGCDDACDSDAECANDGPGRGGCSNLEHCVTANYDKEVKGEDYCDCLIEAILDCFSSESTVQVENKGTAFVKDIKLGDKVLTGSKKYKPVYTIDHKNPAKLTSYVQIFSTGRDSPLEMTESHMVYLHGQQDPVPASAVKVGDSLQTADHFPRVVTDISVVERKGLWNPITTDGTIVVDGIVTSTYNVPFNNNDDEGTHVEVAGLKLVSHHDFLHLLMSPYRALCLGLSQSYCDSKYEYNFYSWMGTGVMKLYHHQEEVVQDIMVLGFLTTFKFLAFLMNPLHVLMILFGIVIIIGRNYKKM